MIFTSTTILIGIILLFILYVLFLYNGLVVAKNRINIAWSGIDNYLKMRADLMPNIVESVKAYAKHEKTTLDSVIQARNAHVSAQTVQDKAAADNMMTAALKSLAVVVESYPDLKASANFQDLNNKLHDMEAKLAYARQFYNDTVLDYNNKIKVFPNILIANLLNFKEAEAFKITEEERKVPSVKDTFQ